MDLRNKDIVAVEYECNEGRFTKSGEFIKQDEDSIMIRGQIGNEIGKPVIIPKSRIVVVVVIQPGRQDES